MTCPHLKVTNRVRLPGTNPRIAPMPSLSLPLRGGDGARRAGEGGHRSRKSCDSFNTLDHACNLQLAALNLGFHPYRSGLLNSKVFGKCLTSRTLLSFSSTSTMSK